MGRLFALLKEGLASMYLGGWNPLYVRWRVARMAPPRTRVMSPQKHWPRESQAAFLAELLDNDPATFWRMYKRARKGARAEG